MRNVHNPLLDLPAVAELQMAGPPHARLYAPSSSAWQPMPVVGASWRRHKGPMAAYWKAVAVYAKHAARALNKPLK